MAVAAIAMQIAESRTLRRGASPRCADGDAPPASRQEGPSRSSRRGRADPAVGVRRSGIAVRRQLERAESENLRTTSLMASLAVVHAGDRVRPPVAERVGVAPAPLRHQSGVLSVLAPGVGGVGPAIRSALHEAGLHPAAVEGELLPQAGPHGEHPGFRVRAVDDRTRRDARSSGAWRRHPSREDTGARRRYGARPPRVWRNRNRALFLQASAVASAPPGS